MGKSRSLALILLLVLGVEAVRELYVLNLLGFQPDRFVEWLRSDVQ